MYDSYISHTWQKVKLPSIANCQPTDSVEGFDKTFPICQVETFAPLPTIQHITPLKLLTHENNYLQMV